MNRSAKEQVYSNVYQSLKENQAISNLGYPEERKHYDFNCSVGPVKVSFADRFKYFLLSFYNCILSILNMSN